MPYLGKTPSQATRQRYYKTASGGETSISGTMTTGGTLTFNDGEFVDVSVNGVALVAGTDYNTSTANTIAGLSALSASDQVEIVVYDTFSVFSGDVDSNLSVGGNLSVTGTTALTGAATITTADNNPQLTLTSTDADANSAPVLHLDRNSASPADDDRIAEIVLRGRNDAGQTVDYIVFDSFIRDASDGTEDAEIDFRTMVAGSEATRMLFKPTETVFNEASIDLDFRVESDGDTHALFLEGSTGHLLINNSSFSSNGTLVVQQTADSKGIAIVDSAAANTFFIENDGTINRIRNNASVPLTFETASTERMRIDSGGKVLIGQTSYSNTSNVSGAQLCPDSPNVLGVNADLVLLVNRRTNDGNLISFQQDKSEEGSISVSGTTVSYNGGHLSRWSQATDGNRIDGLVKGTVMTNLDQMAKWHHNDKAATYYEEGDELPIIEKATYYTDEDVLPDGVSVGDEKTAAIYVSVGDEKTPAVDAYDEDNEQLNCMAVSSVEGDANVAGVFVNWDDDDTEFTTDMNVAMTGDMVIRIAKDTTVARGDLLMSAGDGTAKPQEDDIVRSKTIAKVTSTTKSHTYDDGSYLVPCVLMAC